MTLSDRQCDGKIPNVCLQVQSANNLFRKTCTVFLLNFILVNLLDSDWLKTVPIKH
jgi:hypothetical protein